MLIGDQFARSSNANQSRGRSGSYDNASIDPNSPTPNDINYGKDAVSKIGPTETDELYVQKLEQLIALLEDVGRSKNAYHKSVDHTMTGQLQVLLSSHKNYLEMRK